MTTVTAKDYIDDCLKRRVLFFTGKGGVGKSSVAWAVATALQHRNKRVTFISWNPFDTVGKSGPISASGVEWLPLEASQCFKEYVLGILKFERIYDAVFENHVLKAFIRAAPGISDTVIAGKVWDLFAKGPQDILIVDLPSSGHTLSFFQSPYGVRKMFGLGFVHKEAARICEMFSSPKSRIDFVVTPEELPVEESREFKEKLAKLGPLPFGYVIVNQLQPDFFPVSAAPNKEISEVVERYQARRKLQSAALDAVESLKLPVLKLPKFATENGVATITSLRSVMEATT